jgi:hypothetical protein
MENAGPLRVPGNALMERTLPTDIVALEWAFDAAERDARKLIDGLTETRGTWRVQPGSWSVAECLDHLATSNVVYLRALEPSAERALAAGRLRRGPALPGLLGDWFVRWFEPPVRTKAKAPKKIRPRVSPSLHDAAARFLESQNEIRAFILQYHGIDLAGTTFPNPFIKGVRFSLATGLHVLAAHERRHLWQAWRVREAATLLRDA